MDRRIVIGAVLLLVVIVGGVLLLIGLSQGEANTGSAPASRPEATTVASAA